MDCICLAFWKLVLQRMMLFYLFAVDMSGRMLLQVALHTG